MVRDEIRLKFISVSKQALGFGCGEGSMEMPLARAGRLEALVARRPSRVDEAIELRLRAFDETRLGPLDDAVPIERDDRDDDCVHLVVVDRLIDSVVGSCRLLTPMAARRCGRYFIENAFDLSGVRAIRAQLLELGEIGIESGGRSGTVLMLLWSAIGSYMTTGRYRYLIGTASTSVRQGAGPAASLFDELTRAGLRSDLWRVEPHRHLPKESSATALSVRPTGQFKAYLKAGAQLIGPPGFDPVFDRAVFPMLLDRSHFGFRADRQRSLAR